MATAYINERQIDYASLKGRILNGASALAVQKFDALNAHLPRHFVQAGELVIVPSNTVQESTADEAWFMQRAVEINRVLTHYTGVGDGVVRDYDLLQSVLGYSALGFGSVTSAWSTHLGEVKRTLEDIERAYAGLKSGAVDRDRFFRQREVLLKQLNNQLQGAARFGTGLRGNRSLRGILGISSKSFMQKGEIKHYAERLERMAWVSRHLRTGTFIGLALDVTVAGLEVKEACTEGRDEACQKAKFVEGGRLAGSVVGGYGGGAAGTTLGPVLCRLFLGIATKGVGKLSCGVMGGSAGAYSGGATFGDYGAEWGEWLYEDVDLWT